MLNKMTFTSFMRKFNIEDGKEFRDKLKEAQTQGIDTVEIEAKLNAVMATFSDFEKLGTTIDRHKANDEAVNVDKLYELLHCLSDIIEFLVWTNKRTAECWVEVIAIKEDVIEKQSETINVLNSTVALYDEFVNRFSNSGQETRE